jgi:hypothetical protein
MRLATLVAAVGLSMSVTYGQQSMEVEIVGSATNHKLSWKTTSNYYYHVDCSADLYVWAWTGLSVPGTGSRVTYGFISNSEKLFYRVRVTADPNSGGFLVKPEENDTINQIDGVCFSFDLSGLSSLPDKIRIFERDYNTGDTWNLIGAIEAFDARMGESYVRGSAVWLPQQQGEYEVQAAAVDSSGTVLETAIRRITISEQAPPTISIVGGPSTPSSTSVPLDYSFEFDHDNTVRRIEFYDNGVLIGTATQEPFEETVLDRQGNKVRLLKGLHSIVARAYDYTGAYGESSAYALEVTSGNSRPEITVTSPASGLVVVEGDTFTIQYDPPTDPDGVTDLASVVDSRFIIPFADTNSPKRPETTIAEDTSSPFTALAVDTTGWDPGTYTIKVVVKDVSLESSYHHYFRVEVKSSSSAIFAADLLAEMADEQSVTLSNQKFIGREQSSGTFSNGLTYQLQMDSGILLTTGDFALWDDGDYSSSAGLQLSAQGDFDLENRVSGVQTQDASILEFDVYCPNGQLEFDYQFASEEYDYYVGGYNDAFMVIVDGAIVTLTPDCAGIVAVNTVNNGDTNGRYPPVNRHLFMGDDEDIDADNNLPYQVEYDGLTVRLMAHVFIAPQSTHHVRIIIADVNDGILDSGLFIETDSLRTVVPNP